MSCVASSAFLCIDGLVDLPVLVGPGALRQLLSLVLLSLMVAKLLALLVLVLVHKV